MFHLFKKNTTESIENNYVDGPLLSVVIPSYNHSQFIKEAVDSVLNQTYRNLELIVIDDGSKDNTLEILQSYKDPRMKVISQENQGAHNAINNGLKLSSGEFLAILNSDDIFEKNRFEVMIREMLASPETGFTCSYIRVIDSDGKDLGVKEGWRNMQSWVVPHPELSLAAQDDFKANLLMTNFTSTTSNFLFTRKLYEQIGGMRNLHFAHDWDFALRAAEVTQCKLIEQPLVRYRIHGNNTISTNRKWMLFEIVWMWAANLDRFYQNLLFPDNNDRENIVRLVESLNLQGNDKIFWIIKTFIEVKKAQGETAPEEILLDDEELRNRLLAYVVE